MTCQRACCPVSDSATSRTAGGEGRVHQTRSRNISTSPPTCKSRLVRTTVGWTYGGCGYAYSSIDEDLITRMQRINKKRGDIHRVRLLPDEGYWISDSEGSEWKGLGTHHAAEVKEGGDSVLDTDASKDGSWIVIQ
eukprot:3589253-Rhodomonas_salina.1